jgi:putative transposase
LICEDHGRKVYILVILDLYGRYVLDFDFMFAENTQSVLASMAEKLFKTERPTLFHSDQGREMSSLEFTHLLNLYKVKQSLSKPGHPRHDAVLESFYSSLKVEINLRKLVRTKTPEQIKSIISK